MVSSRDKSQDGQTTLSFLRVCGKLHVLLYYIEILQHRKLSGFMGSVNNRAPFAIADEASFECEFKMAVSHAETNDVCEACVNSASDLKSAGEEDAKSLMRFFPSPKAPLTLQTEARGLNLMLCS